MKLGEMSPISLAGLLLAGAVNLLLLAAVVSEVLPEDAAGSEKIAWKTSLSTSSDGAPKQAPIEAYREILVRPVFFKSREPFVAPPPPPPVAAASPPPMAAIDPGLALGGVMIRKDLRKAYVLSRGGASGAWIKEGEEFQGWKVVSITNGRARLEQSGRSIELALYPSQ